jgi:hypothetical protein
MDKLQIIVVGDAKKIADALKPFGKVEIYDAEGKPISPPAPATGESGRSGN